jgi:dodecin
VALKKPSVRSAMDHTYKVIEIAGSSATSVDDAINNAVTRAAKTVRDLRWFQVSEIRGHIANQKIEHYQVTVKLGFTLEEAD